ncbi:MAG TPA: hypothetical protein VFA32_17255, partial [Dehalococcoidia bacterium]|nr:hypothetical protein [Dehalococcoidia bacterium]
MSDPPTNASTDWRRQQRRGRGSRSSDRPGRGEHGPSRGTPVESPEEEVSDLPEGQAVPSRTLYSFIEPALDAIGSYAAPIVIAGIVGLIVGIVLVAFVGSLRPYGYVIIGFGAVLLAVITLIYLSTVLAAFLSRTGRYGVNSLIMLGAFLGILIVVNLVAFGNRSRIDVTATQQFSLATSTRNLLRDLDEPIKATAFYQDDPLQQQEEQILRR